MAKRESANPSLCKVGITGLDEILCGGLPRNRLYVVQGDPGVGKTTMALVFLLEGLKEGEKGFYITLSETKEELEQTAASHGWSLDGFEILELSTIEQNLHTLSPDTIFHSSELELNRTTDFFINEIDRVKPVRLVLDSLAELRLMAETPLRYRRQMLALKQYFAGRKITVLLLDDMTEHRDQQVQSVAHGVIGLEMFAPDYGPERRRIRIVKLRGVNFHAGYHDYVMHRGGLDVFPRLVAADYAEPRVNEESSTGVDELDQLLGGGITRGTSNLFIGPAGVGKSTIAAQVAAAGACRGERAAIFTFDENRFTFIQRCDALGMEFSKHIESDTIRLEQVDPGALTPGQFIHRIKCEVQQRHARLLVIDSINGYLNAAPDEKFLSVHLHELLSFLGHHDVSTILTVAQAGMIGAMVNPLDVTYLADTVILLRFFEAAGRVRKALSVTKKRTGQPEDTIREFIVEPEGIKVGEPLVNFHGVLTGVPTFTGQKNQMLKEADGLPSSIRR
jgi:circadian clock protein KaiC